MFAFFETIRVISSDGEKLEVVQYYFNNVFEPPLQTNSLKHLSAAEACRL